MAAAVRNVDHLDLDSRLTDEDEAKAMRRPKRTIASPGVPSTSAQRTKRA
jgi:hypothetical protein